MVDIPDVVEKKKGAIVSVLFLLMGITLVFGLIQVRSSVRKPFAKRAVKGPSVLQQIENQEKSDRFALTQKDTDGDGLSDYDELYVTLTSPYLPDSDSDNISDKEEIEKGQDPNCPRGTTCAAAPATGPSPTLPSSPIPPDFSSLLQRASQNEQSQSGLSILSGKASPAEIRAMLQKTGVSEEMLNALDDAALQELYQETLKDMSSGAQNPLGTTPVTSP